MRFHSVDYVRQRGHPALFDRAFWLRLSRGVIGGELVIGRSFPGFGAEVKIGRPSSEHTLAGHVHLGNLAALYLHTEDIGRRMQRLLNPSGEHSRVIGVNVRHGLLEWNLWAKRHEWSRDDPWWQRGSFRVRPRDIVFGPARNSVVRIGDPEPAIMRMPHGDDHRITVQRESWTQSRPRACTKRLPWTADVQVLDGGIRTGPKGDVLAFNVNLGEAVVEDGGWVEQAAARAAEQMTNDRIRSGYVGGDR